jgi:ankyrin repeat protein
VAFRGGTRTVIVPGSAESSRLYLRLTGHQFGNRMPPAGPLSAEQIAVFKAWIDQGAHWPDDMANETVLPAPDPKAVQMAGDLRAGRKVASEDAQSVNLRGPGGSTPFMYAVLYGDAATVGRMLEKGADANHRNDAGATALMWAAGSLEKARLLVEHGADVNAVSDDGRTPLAIASMEAGNAAVVKFLLEHGAKVNQRRAQGGEAQPLREAAAAADAEIMKLLIDHGADVKAAGGGALAAVLSAHCSACVDLLAKGMDARAYSTALLDVAVFGEAAAVKFTLDHGANVHIKDVEGRTPLMMAANSDRVPLEAVKLLVDHGSDVNARNLAGQSVLDMARLHGNTSVVALLTKSGAKGSAPAAPAFKTVESNTIAAAVERSLPLLQKADASFLQKAGCISCHNEGLTAMTLGVARRQGFRVDEETAKSEVRGTVAFEDVWRDRMLQGLAAGGVAYTLVGLDAVQYAPDFTTDAIVRDIRLHQLGDGHWRPGCGGARPPHCGAEITNTALSMRALKVYGAGADRAELEKAADRAADWLRSASPQTTEDRVFRLMGLAWAGKDRDAIQKARQELLSTQRPDGGWADMETLPSGPYATGEALVVLHEGGLAAGDAAYQRGVKYLLKTQLTDGSWYAKTRSLPVQPYFDVGFPHGVDQWISTCATSWSTMALALASEAAPAPAGSPTAAAALR